MTARGIEARSDETAQQARPEGRKPGPQDAPSPYVTPSQPDTFAGEVTRLVADLCGIKGAFERIAQHHPNDQPAYKNGVRPWGTGDLRHVIDTLSAAVSALSTPSAGEGLVLVPREVTTEMRRALWRVVPRTGHEATAQDVWSAMIAAAPANPSLSGTGEVERTKAVLEIAKAAHAIGWQAGVGAMETAGAIVSYLAQHQDQIEPFFAGEASPIDWPDFTHGGCLSWRAGKGDKLVYPADVRAARAALRPTNGSTEA